MSHLGEKRSFARPESCLRDGEKVRRHLFSGREQSQQTLTSDKVGSRQHRVLDYKNTIALLCFLMFCAII